MPLRRPASPRLRKPFAMMGPDAEGTKDDSDADDEKQFDKSTGKNRNYTGCQKYRLVKEWVTREDAVLEEAEIHRDEEIYACEWLEKDSRSQTKGDGYSPLEAVFQSLSQQQESQDRRLDAAFSMSSSQSMWMSSAGESNYRRQLHSARILW